MFLLFFTKTKQNACRFSVIVKIYNFNKNESYILLQESSKTIIHFFLFKEVALVGEKFQAVKSKTVFPVSLLLMISALAAERAAGLDLRSAFSRNSSITKTFNVL